MYPRLGAVPNAADLRWTFPKGASVKFAHLQHESTVEEYQGAQIALIMFDEITHFTEFQFTYMLSRNRSTSGVRPYVRATCNPDAASWVARWVEWYIDPTTGYALPERAGRIRWFVRDGDNLRWADTREELEKDYPPEDLKSFTFIPAKLEDNKILMEKDPGYRANLKALPRVEQERLYRGNWLVSNAKGEWPPDYFGRHLWVGQFPPRDQWDICTMAWDPSKGSDSTFGDYSAITLLVRDKAGNLYAAAWMGRWSVEEGIDQVLELVRVHRPDGLAIETNQFQQLVASQLIARAKVLGIAPPVYEIDNRVKKEVRIRRLGPYLHSKTLRLLGDQTGARILAEQLMTFPNGDHDDGPDSLEMALRLMTDLYYGAHA